MRLLSRSTPCCGIACVADRTARSSPLWQGAVPFVASASLAAAVASIASPAAAATNASGLAAEPVFVFGIPVDFILFALTLLGVALFHHKTLQVALAGLAAILVYKFAFTGFKFGPGLAGLGLHMQHECGDPSEPVPAADGFRHPVAALREQPHPRRDAGLPAGRLEGRLGAARDRVRAVELPRQHRGRADRRHDGAARVQRQSPHRLSRRHRGRLQRRRIRQRRGRHHDDHDVDRRRQPAVGARSLCRGRRRLPDLRHPGGDPAAPLFADPQRRAARPPDRLDFARDRRADPGHCDRRQRHRQSAIPGAPRHRAGDRAGGVDRDPCHRCRCGGRTGRSCPRPSRARSSCSRW